MEALDEIWAGDLFDRQGEATDLVGYLESVAGRPAIREDSHAYVLAVDTAYGHGKTFFLKRLDRHLQCTEHVSAYIDAWVDDLEDQPIVALAATLDGALAPWAAKSDAVANGLTQFKAKAGRVAKIVSIGLAKRGAGFLITQGAAEALGDEFARVSEATRDRADEALNDAGTAIIDGVATVLEPATAPSMEARIARFREGQAAIQAMKDSLAIVVAALAEAGMKLPITIIVDELDRCRPTYAIKVLEEIKHLFDVAGVAFILGMHGRQLEHSITAAYGQNFDSSSYLRRFFNRRYSLRALPLTPLIQHLITTLDIKESRIEHPPISDLINDQQIKMDAATVIASYLEIYDLSARDAFSIMEDLHTSMALVGESRVFLAYLLPLIISRYKGADTLLMPSKEAHWGFKFYRINDQDHVRYSTTEFLKGLNNAAKMNDRQLSEAINRSDLTAELVSNYGFMNDSSHYNIMQNYGKLVGAVARFS